MVLYWLYMENYNRYIFFNILSSKHTRVVVNPSKKTFPVIIYQSKKAIVISFLQNLNRNLYTRYCELHTDFRDLIVQKIYIRHFMHVKIIIYTVNKIDTFMLAWCM